MGQLLGKLDGKDIKDVDIHYENLYISTVDGDHYYFSLKDVLGIMNEFLFDVEKKKTRTWLHPVTPDVDLLYDQERYK